MKARSRGVAPQQRDHCAPQRTREHPGDRRQTVAVLTQDVADARAVACADRLETRGRELLLSVQHDERRVVLDRALPCRARARGSRSPRPRTTLRPRRGRGPRRSAPTRSTSAARMKIVNEIARFQRLSRVSTAAPAPTMTTSSVLVYRSPGQCVELRADPRSAARPARGDPLGRRSRRPGNATSRHSTAECSVAGPRETSLGAQPRHLD